MTPKQTRELARNIRVHVLRMLHHAGASHAGTCLSIADVLAVLYGTVLRVDPKQPELAGRDRLVVSKGHGAAAVYATLAERGFFPVEWLQTYCDDESPLAGHVTHRGVPGIEASTGSLGHGLAIGCGMALAASGATRVFVILSDGELNEGSTWESVFFAAHRRLCNLVAIVDVNRIQSFGRTAEVLDMEPLADKFAACGWDAVRIDGHDHEKLAAALAGGGERPRAILADTVKGKGVSFMEDKLAWHYQSPDRAQLAAALRELGEGA